MIYNKLTQYTTFKESVFRVVIMTYDRLRAEYRNKYLPSRQQDSSSTTPSDAHETIFDIEWHRVVLDEAHVIKSGTLLQESTKILKSRFRWCITGTPLQVSFVHS